jgi:hypothetical protein
MRATAMGMWRRMIRARLMCTSTTSISSATFVPNEDSEATIIGTGLHNGVPVGFTMVAVDNQGLAPGVYTLILTDGYVFTGNVVSGSIVLQ